VATRRSVLVAAGAGAVLAYGGIAPGQTTVKVPRIGFLSGRGEPTAANPDPNGSAFRDELQKLGLTDGKNIRIEYRYAGGQADRARDLAIELVRLPVDVLVTPAAPSIRAAKAATSTVPIVIVATEDPVAAGYVESLARPGGNVTGITRRTVELIGKRIELLKEILPRALHIGVIYDSTTGTSHQKIYEAHARALKMQILSLAVQGANPDLATTIRVAANKHLDALVIVRTPLLLRFKNELFELVLKNRLAAICEGAEEAAAGGLASYATDDAAGFRRAAYYVDRILKGAKPADIPVEQSNVVELVINMRTARALGITIPQSILVRANRVIE
jgi:putative ABC transport system substrate-binding protein